MNTFIRISMNLLAFTLSLVLVFHWHNMNELMHVMFFGYIAVTIGYDIIYLFGNVDHRIHRRPLQNFVYRLYEFAYNLQAFAAAVDSFVDTLYSTTANIVIQPINERVHLKKPVTEPIVENVYVRLGRD